MTFESIIIWFLILLIFLSIRSPIIPRIERCAKSMLSSEIDLANKYASSAVQKLSAAIRCGLKMWMLEGIWWSEISWWSIMKICLFVAASSLMLPEPRSKIRIILSSGNWSISSWFRDLIIFVEKCLFNLSRVLVNITAEVIPSVSKWFVFFH